MKYFNITTDWILQLANTKKQKKKYSIYKESNQFANQFDFTPKGIDIKIIARETAKIKKR